MKMGEPERALDYLGVFASINPAWAKLEMQDALYQPLRASPLFVAWTAMKSNPDGKE